MNNRNLTSSIAIRNKSPNFFVKSQKYVDHFRSWFRNFLETAE
jgi:hypothetical protein